MLPSNLLEAGLKTLFVSILVESMAPHTRINKLPLTKPDLQSKGLVKAWVVVMIASFLVVGMIVQYRTGNGRDAWRGLLPPNDGRSVSHVLIAALLVLLWNRVV